MIRNSIQRFRRMLLDRFVLRPTRQAIDYAPKTRHVLDFHGKALECFLYPRDANDEPADMLVLKFPGTAGRAERASAFPVNMLRDVNADTWILNPPGYGGSEGHASLDGMADASLCFCEQVLTKYPEISRVWICGNSLGCVSALYAAANSLRWTNRRTISIGLVLRNPPPLTEVFKREADRYPLAWLAYPIADSLSESMDAKVSAAQSSHPAVFFQCELDSLVPPHLQSLVHQAYRGPKRIEILKGLDHGDIAGDSHMNQIQQSIQWLWEQTESATKPSEAAS